MTPTAAAAGVWHTSFLTVKDIAVAVVSHLTMTLLPTTAALAVLYQNPLKSALLENAKTLAMTHPPPHHHRHLPNHHQYHHLPRPRLAKTKISNAALAGSRTSNPIYYCKQNYWRQQCPNECAQARQACLIRRDGDSCSTVPAVPIRPRKL